MAKGTGESGDWTAGIVAIVSALLLGGGIPVALYFGLYMPKVDELAAVQQEEKEVQAQYEAETARGTRVAELEGERDEMKERLVELEDSFAAADAEDGFTLSDALLDIEDLAAVHHLTPRQELARRREANMVGPAGGAIEFPNGLRAVRFAVEAQARYHDFGRFLAALESRDQYTIVPEDLVCQGDATRGTRHVFVLHFYILQKRDLDEIGT